MGSKPVDLNGVYKGFKSTKRARSARRHGPIVSVKALLDDTHELLACGHVIAHRPLRHPHQGSVIKRRCRQCRDSKLGWVEQLLVRLLEAVWP